MTDDKRPTMNAAEHLHTILSMTRELEAATLQNCEAFVRLVGEEVLRSLVSAGPDAAHRPECATRSRVLKHMPCDCDAGDLERGAPERAAWGWLPNGSYLGPWNDEDAEKYQATRVDFVRADVADAEAKAATVRERARCALLFAGADDEDLVSPTEAMALIRKSPQGPPSDPRPRCIKCSRRWVPNEGVDASLTPCPACDPEHAPFEGDAPERVVLNHRPRPGVIASRAYVRADLGGEEKVAELEAQLAAANAALLAWEDQARAGGVEASEHLDAIARSAAGWRAAADWAQHSGACTAAGAGRIRDEAHRRERFAFAGEPRPASCADVQAEAPKVEAPVQAGPVKTAPSGLPELPKSWECCEPIRSGYRGHYAQHAPTCPKLATPPKPADIVPAWPSCTEVDENGRQCFRVLGHQGPHTSFPDLPGLAMSSYVGSTLRGNR